MPPRMVRTDPGQKTISRTALDGLSFKNFEKDERVRVIQRFSMVYAVGVLGFLMMDNHFHRLIGMGPRDLLVDDEVWRRFFLLYNKGAEFFEGQMTHFRARLKSVIAYKGSSVINCLAPIILGNGFVMGVVAVLILGHIVYPLPPRQSPCPRDPISGVLDRRWLQWMLWV